MTPNPGPSPSPPLQLDAVSFRYDQAAGAVPEFMLRDVSLTLAPGELIALIGQNGSGKTTLARLCNGLLRPTGGRVLVNGKDSRDRTIAELAASVGYVFQNPDHQLFAPTVAEDVAFGPRNLGLPPNEVQHRVNEALADLDLESLADHHPLLLSYGERKLVAVAGVLALGSPVLILDEPTAGLDPNRSELLLQVVERRRQAGTAVLMITHDLALAAEQASRVVALAGGQVVADGSPRAVLTDPDTLAAAGLAPSSVVRLAQLLLPAGLPGDILTMPELVREYERLYRTRREDVSP